MTPVSGDGPVRELLSRASTRQSVPPGDGLSGAACERVTVDETAYFVKRLSPASDWVMRVTGDHVHRPYLVWQAGIMDRAPGCIDHTLVAMDLDDSGGDAVLTMLMRDVGGFLVPPGDTVVPPGQHAGFVAHMAELAAAFWDWHDDIGLTTMAQRLRLFAPDNIAGELAAAEVPGPIAAAAAGWQALPGRSPLLAAIARLVHDQPEVITGPLAATPRTFVHGDWKMGNLGTPPGRAHDPARLGPPGLRPGLLGPVLVPGAQPGPAARAEGDGDQPVPGRARSMRHRHRWLVAAAARPVHDRRHGHVRLGEGTRRRRRTRLVGRRHRARGCPPRRRCRPGWRMTADPHARSGRR